MENHLIDSYVWANGSPALSFLMGIESGFKGCRTLRRGQGNLWTSEFGLD